MAKSEYFFQVIFLVFFVTDTTHAFIRSMLPNVKNQLNVLKRTCISEHRRRLSKNKICIYSSADIPGFVASNIIHFDNSLSNINLLAASSLDAVKDASSLGNADETLQIMIKAVDIGPGSENLQKGLSVLVNTPGFRQILQIVIPPLAIIVTDLVKALLPTYIAILDAISKTGGHEGLLPDGVDVTMKAVQRLAAQGEIIRAFKVLQAGIPLVHRDGRVHRQHLSSLPESIFLANCAHALSCTTYGFAWPPFSLCFYFFLEFPLNT